MTDGRVHQTATGFDVAAQDYARHRPGYPAAAVTHVTKRLHLGPGRRVLDLAAGTGILTRDLAATGADVIAVEPSAPMRAELHATLPDVEVLDGTAEALPLPPAAVDAVTVAQAFHWFDPSVALAEIHRVLRPDGHLAVLFNIRDLDDPLQAAMDDFLAPYQADTPSWANREWDEPLRTSPLFTPPEETVYPNRQVLDRAGLVGRVTSVSFVARLDPVTRGEVVRGIGELFDRHARDGTVVLPYRTEVSLLRRRPG